MRVRSQRNRWQEEARLTHFEMEWVIRFFMFKSTTWQERANAAILEPAVADTIQSAAAASPDALFYIQGLKEYCLQQSDMWNELGRMAQQQFIKVNSSCPNIWVSSSPL